MTAKEAVVKLREIIKEDLEPLVRTERLNAIIDQTDLGEGLTPGTDFVMTESQHNLLAVIFEDANRLRAEGQEVLKEASRQFQRGWETVREWYPELRDWEFGYDWKAKTLTLGKPREKALTPLTPAEKDARYEQIMTERTGEEHSAWKEKLIKSVTQEQQTAVEHKAAFERFNERVEARKKKAAEEQKTSKTHEEGPEEGKAEVDKDKPKSSL